MPVCVRDLPLLCSLRKPTGCGQWLDLSDYTIRSPDGGRFYKLDTALTNIKLLITG